MAPFPFRTVTQITQKFFIFIKTIIFLSLLRVTFLQQIRMAQIKKFFSANIMKDRPVSCNLLSISPMLIYILHATLFMLPMVHLDKEKYQNKLFNTILESKICCITSVYYYPCLLQVTHTYVALL